MHTVKVSLGDRSYDIEIGASLEKTGERLKGLGFGRKMALVTNPTVKTALWPSRGGQSQGCRVHGHVHRDPRWRAV